MYEIKCCICGKEATVVNSRYKTCSKTCSKALTEKLKREWCENHPSRKTKAYRSKRKKNYYCHVCGAVLSHGCQKYCFDCLLKNYKYGDRKRAYHILYCRGYDRDEIKNAIKEKGI
jgi:hypothetical protein